MKSSFCFFLLLISAMLYVPTSEAQVIKWPKVQLYGYCKKTYPGIIAKEGLRKPTMPTYILYLTHSNHKTKIAKVFIKSVAYNYAQNEVTTPVIDTLQTVVLNKPIQKIDTLVPVTSDGKAQMLVCKVAIEKQPTNTKIPVIFKKYDCVVLLKNGKKYKYVGLEKLKRIGTPQAM